MPVGSTLTFEAADRKPYPIAMLNCALGWCDACKVAIQAGYDNANGIDHYGLYPQGDQGHQTKVSRSNQAYISAYMLSPVVRPANLVQYIGGDIQQLFNTSTIVADAVCQETETLPANKVALINQKNQLSVKGRFGSALDAAKRTFRSYRARAALRRRMDAA